jgi:hypothetical protein
MYAVIDDYSMRTLEIASHARQCLPSPVRAGRSRAAEKCPRRSEQSAPTQSGQMYPCHVGCKTADAIDADATQRSGVKIDPCSKNVAEVVL